MDAMKTKAIAPYFGSNRMLAHEVGNALRGSEWVGVGFAGGMSELPYVTARTIVVNDTHRHIVNLAMVIATQSEQLKDALHQLPFHPDILKAAQDYCLAWERQSWSIPDYEAAKQYFIAVWMGRSTKAGTDGEFKGKLSTRWTATGGDSNTRYRSAIASLDEWSKIMRRCNFSTLDVFEFIAKMLDKKGHSGYFDPPFFGPGDAYKHKFGEDKHRKLALRLAAFRHARIVCRFYDVPLIRELYPESHWTWRFLEGGRTQANKVAPEVLIINKAGNTEKAA